MRRLGTVATTFFLAARLAILVAAPAWAAPVDGDGAPQAVGAVLAPAPEGERYVLRIEADLDSLVLQEAGGVEGAARVWERADLTDLAERVRARLAAEGLLDATLVLQLVPSSGTTPGAATASIRRIPTLPIGSGTTSPLGQAPARAVAVVRQSGLEAGFDAARSFARGSGGGSTAADIAAGLAAVRDDAVALGRYAVSVGIDSVVAKGPTDSVHVTVACGPPLTLESIELAGGTSTRPGSAASISGLRYGRPVTPAALDEARARLEASELFTMVGEPRVLPGTEPGRAKVVVPVEEARGSRFEGAIGVAREGGVTGLVDLALGNIGGTGRGAGARWAGLGDGRSEYRLHYREPALFGKPVTAGITLEAEIAESLFTQTRWSLGFGGRPAGGLAAGLALARSSSVYSGLSRGSSATWSVEGTAAWRGAHPKANPTRGMGLTLQGELGTRTETYPGFAEISRSLRSFSGVWEGANPLGGRRVLYARARAEQVTLTGDDIPADELRYLGGSEGLRGHRDRAFAGNRILSFTAEPRWITDPAGGRLFLFLDVARHELGAPVAAGVPVDPAVTTSLARTTLSDGWEMGYGAGLRSRMASGLVGLELGLRPGAAVREATIHIRYASTW